MALASRKYLTTDAGLQPTCGDRTSRPQHGPAPAGGGGAEAGCGPVPAGMTEQPLATTAATTSPVTSPVRPRGRRDRAAHGSRIGAPPKPVAATRIGTEVG